jgi:hypothetical protein
MKSLKAPEWLLLIGGCFFILILGISAVWEADIRWLHFFQAWMYIAAIALSLRRVRWGYFIGISAAGLWDYANIVATTFFLNGLQQLAHWLQTGHLERADLLIAVPAWFSNLFVVVGCVWAYARLPEKSLSDVVRFRPPSFLQPDSSLWTCSFSSPAISASSHACCIRTCHNQN